MRGRVFQLVLVLSVSALAVGASPQPPDPSFIVHEWGTFTSIAGEDGSPATWAPLFGAADLPCFVSRPAPGALTKWQRQISGLVRMETPERLAISGTGRRSAW